MNHQCEMYPCEEVWDEIFLAIEEGKPPPWPEMRFHLNTQDTNCRAWQALLQLVEDAAHDKREVFSPREDIGQELWNKILTLPASIANLKHVKKLNLYRSKLISIPPEIGAMENLVEFIPYNSYGLHWFPYEITRCKNLRASAVSTRALYGNYKYRPPFPNLEQPIPELITATCSVCGKPNVPSQVQQVWISLGVATDVLPLLVNACSSDCVSQLPTPSGQYLLMPHKGGPTIQQPPPW